MFRGCLEDLNNKSLDLMELIERRLGHNVSLQNLIKPTLGISKNGSGKLAVQWALEGEFEQLAEYCRGDVEATKDLFLHGLLKNEVLYDYHGDVRKLKIDWINPERKFAATEFTYSLYDPDKGDVILLDKDNKDFFHALELVRTTRRNLFVTGKAGTGKTTFLKYVKSHVSKRTAIVAYTGVAAINAGGQTIHSFFKIDPKGAPFTPWDKRLRRKAPVEDVDKTTIYSHFQYKKDRRDIFESLELLIIDEVSMVRADFLDVIDKVLRAFSGRDSSLPFGGVQVVLIGDTFQLPPIEGDEWKILQQFYQSPFFFSANVVKDNLPLQIELKKIYRQNELEFITLLNRVRINQPSEQDLILLNNKVRGIRNEDFEDNYIVLCSTNAQATEINLGRLKELAGVEKTYEGAITGSFPESSRPTELYLKLKEGAQVMFLKNGPSYYNGKIGTVVSLETKEIVVQIKNSLGEVSLVKVEKYTWENVTYTYNPKTREIEMQVIGTYTQYPLKLAWAITVHKSQGLTFEKVFVDINHFAPSGLTYVALSRCTSLQGLALKQPLQRRAINTDVRVIEFAQNVAPETLVAEVLTEGKADSLYAEAYNSYKAGMFTEAFASIVKAVKYRNDIETPNFRKVIVHILKVGRHNKTLIDIVKREFESERLGFQHELDSKEQEKAAVARKGAQALKDLSIRLDSQIQKLLSDKTSLANQRDLLTKERLTYLETNAVLKKKIEEANKRVMFLENGKSRLIDEVRELKEKLESCEKEKVRLSKITWLQKLLGKK